MNRQMLLPALVLAAVYTTPTAALTLIYSGNLNGELEPCGCSEAGDLGGIQRRLTVLQQLRDQSPELVAISAGGLLASEAGTDTIKNRFILSGFQALQYDAVGLQWRDLVMGPEPLQASGAPWLASNWRGDAFAHSIELTRGNTELAVFSWLDPEGSPYRAMQGPLSEVVEPSAKRLDQALRQARLRGALTLLTTTLAAEQAAALIDLAQVDILIEQAAFEQFGAPRRLGTTLVLQPGSRGQRIGRIELTRGSDGRIADWTHQVIAMPALIPKASALDDWYADYNAALKADYLERVALRKAREAGSADYLGAAACQGCHAEQHAAWSASHHATALQRLEEVDKAYDPNCLECHTVGFLQPGGFLDRFISSHLAGVQCENCHGQGRQHVASQGQQATPNRSLPMAEVCAGCHNHDHSPTFVLEQYWPRIQH